MEGWREEGEKWKSRTSMETESEERAAGAIFFILEFMVVSQIRGAKYRPPKWYPSFGKP